MHFGETIGLLLAVTIAAIVLRAYWHRLPRRVENVLLTAGAVAVVIRFIFIVTLWTTVYPHVNAVISWLSVIAYELVLVRFSLMRPRWLTSICAFILVLPMFGSTLLFPLTGIFDTEPSNVRPVAKNYELQRDPWDVKISGRSGYDFGVFYRPGWLPFMHHIAQRSSFSKDQCRADEVSVSIDAQRHLVHFHCPGHHGAKDDIDLTLPLK